MADVFICFAPEDRAWVRALGDALQGAGFSVLWDLSPELGQAAQFDIESELAAAKAVIAVWSSASRTSNWVRDIAQEALDRGSLLPVLKDVDRPPLGFRQMRSADLRAWTGAASPEWLELVSQLHGRIGAAQAPAPQSDGGTPESEIDFERSTIILKSRADEQSAVSNVSAVSAIQPSVAPSQALSGGTSASSSSKFVTAATTRYAAPGDLRMGDEVGQYRIVRRLGAGGFGAVYEAANIHNEDERVAMKLLLADVAASERFAQLLKLEANALLRLKHPAVVQYRVFGRIADTDQFYLVTEFVPGPTLRDWRRKAVPTIAQVKMLAVRLAQGLAAAHRRGIVHRDLAPDNVIVTSDDLSESTLIDFGIARLGDGDALGGAFAGKFSYAAPEQFEFDTLRLGPSIDIYAFGLLIAAFVRGRPIDMGRDLEAAKAKRRSIPDLSDIPPLLRPALTALLQIDPAARPRNMDEVSRIFEAIPEVELPVAEPEPVVAAHDATIVQPVFEPEPEPVPEPVVVDEAPAASAEEPQFEPGPDRAGAFEADPETSLEPEQQAEADGSADDESPEEPAAFAAQPPEPEIDSWPVVEPAGPGEVQPVADDVAPEAASPAEPERAEDAPSQPQADAWPKAEPDPVEIEAPPPSTDADSLPEPDAAEPYTPEPIDFGPDEPEQPDEAEPLTGEPEAPVEQAQPADVVAMPLAEHVAAIGDGPVHDVFEAPTPELTPSLDEASPPDPLPAEQQDEVELPPVADAEPITPKPPAPPPREVFVPEAANDGGTGAASRSGIGTFLKLLAIAAVGAGLTFFLWPRGGDAPGPVAGLENPPAPQPPTPEVPAPVPPSPDPEPSPEPDPVPQPPVPQPQPQPDPVPPQPTPTPPVPIPPPEPQPEPAPEPVPVPEPAPPLAPVPLPLPSLPAVVVELQPVPEVPPEPEAPLASGRIEPAPAGEKVQAQTGQKYGAANTDARIIYVARRETTLQVFSGGKERIGRPVLPGDSFRLPNTSDVTVSTPDAGAIDVILDGVFIGRAGPDGHRLVEMKVTPVLYGGPAELPKPPEPEPTPQPPAPTPQPPKPEPPKPEPPKPQPTDDAQAIANQSIAAMNAIRAGSGLKPVAWSGPLQRVAATLAANDAAMGGFQAVSNNVMLQMIIKAGYGNARASKSVARRQKTVQAVFDFWRGQGGVAQLLADPNIVAMGFAMARASDGTPYYTMILAYPP